MLSAFLPSLSFYSILAPYGKFSKRHVLKYWYMRESSFSFSATNTSPSFTKPRHQSDSECALQPRVNFHCISFDEGLKMLIFYSELKTVKRKVLVLETLNNSLRMSASKAVSKQRQGGWSSCLGRILRSQLLFPLARECANHHPKCRKPGPDSRERVPSHAN